MIDLRTARLIDFVPESIAGDPEVVALCAALDPQHQAVSSAIVETIILARIADLDEPVLDAVAWGFKLDRLRAWDLATVAQKRLLLAGAVFYLRRSGTPAAIRWVLRCFPWATQLIEWYAEGAANQTWRLIINHNGSEVSRDQVVALEELVHRFGRTAAHLEEVRAFWTVDGPVRRLPNGASDPNAVTFRVGDGTGVPTAGVLSGLVHQVASFSIGSVNCNSHGTLVSVTIPGNSGGYTIREAGLFNAAGEILIGGTVVPFYKTTSGDPLEIPLVLQVVTP